MKSLIGSFGQWWGRDKVARYASWFFGCCVLLGLCFFLVSFFGNFLVFLSSIDGSTSAGAIAPSERDLILLMRQCAAGCLVIGVIAASFVWLKNRVGIPTWLLKFVASTISGSAVLEMLFRTGSQEAPFYSLKQILIAPETMRVFGRRLLLVWPARWMYHHLPGCTPQHAFFLIQTAAICVTVTVVGIWSAKFVGWHYAFIGQFLLIVLVSPTFWYFNYYDIFIIATFTAALLCLWDRHYLLFCIITGAGTLNHENTLLLVFVALAVCYKRETPQRIAAVTGGALAAWLVAKISITLAVPMPASVDYRVITNLWLVTRKPYSVLCSFLELSPMLLCTVFGWRAASAMLRRGALLFVPLFGVTFLFGKFDEARQFDAFIPLAIAFALGSLSQYALASNPGVSCTGKLLFPDVKQFDERVYEQDGAGNQTTNQPGSVILNGSVH